VRDEPFWVTAAAERDRVVLRVGAGRDVTAGELLDLLDQPPGADVAIPAADPVVAVAAHLAARRGADPPDAAADAAARRAAVTADVLGLTPGGTVLVLLPYAHPFTLDLVACALHGRRRVVAGATDAAAALRAQAGPVDVVAARPTLDALVTVAPHLLASSLVPRVVALGALDGAGLRDRLRAAAGADTLVEVAGDAAGLDSLVAPVGSTLGGFWSWAPGRREDAALLTDDGVTVTAGALYDRALALAGALAADGAGTVVGAFGDGIDMVTALLAAIRAGTFLVPVSPEAPPAEIRHYASAAGARSVVTAAATRAAIAAVVAPLPVHDVADLVARALPPPPEGRPAGGLRAFTSGTTGAARAVVQPAHRLAPQLRAAWDVATVARIGIAGPGRHLVAGQPHQLAPLTTACAALHAGQALVLLRAWSPKAAAAALRDLAPTTAFFVPSMFAGLLALPEETRRDCRPSALVAAVHSTAACPVATKQAMLDWWGPVLYERYGAAEAPGTYVTPDEWQRRPGTVGRPFPGVVVRVLGADGEPCAPHEHGRVFLSDSRFAYGDGSSPYERRDGLVSVGDVGYLDDAGWLFLVGRETDFISVGGAKFHPAEVEDVLRGHPYVGDCAVVPLAHARLGQVPVAYVVLDTAAPRDAAEVSRALGAHVRAALPPTRRPMRYRTLAALPRNAAGKVLRGELAARATTDETGR
jgi:long-chain acyl-CoA synthetase